MTLTYTVCDAYLTLYINRIIIEKLEDNNIDKIFTSLFP